MPHDTRVEDTVASYWSKRSSSGAPEGWWEVPYVIRRINELVCGEAIDGFSHGLIRRAKQMLGPRVPLQRGISVGSGSADKEMHLLQEGLVQEFDLYELSPARIEQGKATARKLGLGDRVRFHCSNPLSGPAPAPGFDLVHWNNALHHMMDVDAAVRWSRDALVPRGMLFVDDYVGPNRMQYTRQMLELATFVRRGLPARLLRRPTDAGSRLGRLLGRLGVLQRRQVALPDGRKIAEVDPSEAPDSARIPEAIRRYFPDADIVPTGGVVYHIALGGCCPNLDPERDLWLLDLLMTLDAHLASQGHTLYATALAII